MKRVKTTFYTIEWNKETGEERELVISYHYYAGTHFPIDSVTVEPNDPEEVEVLSAMMDSPTAYDRNAKEDVWDSLDAKTQEAIEQKCIRNEATTELDYGD